MAQTQPALQGNSQTDLSVLMQIHFSIAECNVADSSQKHTDKTLLSL